MTIRTEEGKVEVSKHRLEADRTLKLGDDQGDKVGGGVCRDRFRIWSASGIISTFSFNFGMFIEKICKLVIHIFN